MLHSGNIFACILSFQFLIPSTVLWYCSRPNIKENNLVRKKKKTTMELLYSICHQNFYSFKHLVDMLPCFLFSLYHPRRGIPHPLTGLLDLNQNHSIQSVPYILSTSSDPPFTPVLSGSHIGLVAFLYY